MRTRKSWVVPMAMAKTTYLGYEYYSGDPRFLQGWFPLENVNWYSRVRDGAVYQSTHGDPYHGDHARLIDAALQGGMGNPFKMRRDAYLSGTSEICDNREERELLVRAYAVRVDPSTGMEIAGSRIQGSLQEICEFLEKN